MKFFIDSDSGFALEDVRHSIWDSMLSLLGEKGSANVNLKVSEWNEENNIGIARCSLDSVDDLIVSLKTMTDIQGARVNVLVKGVSGTLKSLEKC
ncbi:MAG TPA: Rpp14/Pop5 family protein [Candidatus Methanofastidiosa archaeon]|nr:Rpp14/Pop5 family protein [Candidatus Methanofastidiosa archaeon]HPR40979.1 Rpp14/Pop5 family protein [Candidatus Methanofastidiosa archaeon]